MKSRYSGENKPKINNIDHLFPAFYAKQTFIVMAEAIPPLQTPTFKHFQQFGKKLLKRIKSIDFLLRLLKISLPPYSSSFAAQEIEGINKNLPGYFRAK